MVHHVPVAIDEIPLAKLRDRRSVKWRTYGDDVIPAWVAEMDFTLAEPIAAALRAAIDRSDTGYRWADEVPEVLADFTARTWGWQVSPDRVMVLADVMTGIAQSLIRLTDPGDHVVINPPVYPPFFSTVRDVANRTVREVPMLETRSGYRLDLERLGEAFAEPRVRAYVLCSPHNPTGTVHTAQELATVAELAARHDVLVISDEIHAPMTLPGAVHTPYLSIAGDDARATACLSASKSWNIPGLKCAQVVGTASTMPVLVETVPIEATFGVGHFGVIGTLAAYRDGGAWLTEAIAALDSRRDQLAKGLGAIREAGHGVEMVWPEASYLAWVRVAGLGEDPATVVLDNGKVAVNSGLPFGDIGAGYLRINYATSQTVLAQVIEALGAVVDDRAS